MTPSSLEMGLAHIQEKDKLDDALDDDTAGMVAQVPLAWGKL